MYAITNTVVKFGWSTGTGIFEIDLEVFAGPWVGNRLKLLYSLFLLVRLVILAILVIASSAFNTLHRTASTLVSPHVRHGVTTSKTFRLNR